MSFTEILMSMGGKTDKESRHGYGKWYDLWLSEYKDKATNVLEVGVCQFGGGCVLALAEYFHSAQIWGADISDERCFPEVFSDKRIKFLKGNAYDGSLAGKLDGTQFDVIIDDASHEVADQISLLRDLKPFLKEDGIYIIEDCCTCHWLPHLPKIWKMGLQHTLIDATTPDTYDNTLIMLRHKK